MVRYLSIIARKIKSYKGEAKVLQQFASWEKQLENLPSPGALLKLLIIRVDDIGDYILFRNFLGSYKISPRWKDYEITLLGNIVWKELFEAYDANTVNSVIWIDKKQYLINKIYRDKLWFDLRNKKFETVICPSRTRQLLLDDACALATGAANKIAAINTTYHIKWNKRSNAVYTELFSVADTLLHEFSFNKAFTQWCCLTDQSTIKLSFPHTSQNSRSHIICFISASTNSKKWSAHNWIRLIELLQRNYPHNILIAGSADDGDTAAIISSATNTRSVAGKTTLIEVTGLIANAAIVVCNDTMAAHVSAACNIPTVIIANGNNFYRFTDYHSAGIYNVRTLYPIVFVDTLKHKGKAALREYIAVTADISTIEPAAVLDAVDKLLQK